MLLRAVARLFGLTAGLLTFTAAVAAAGSVPLTGAYRGHSTTNVKGNKPLGFSMTIASGKCAAAGATKRRPAYCVAVDANSLVQSPCSASGFVADEFFPATEPIALPRSLRISHRYPLYLSGGQIYDRRIAGAAKLGSFQITLKVSTHGRASGSMRFIAHTASDGTCDSGTVKIVASHKG